MCSITVTTKTAGLSSFASLKILHHDDQSLRHRPEGLSKSRGWLIAGGILSILVGLLAMGSPLLFSIVIAQFLGAFALVSGAISLFLALFGKEVTHRVS